MPQPRSGRRQEQPSAAGPTTRNQLPRSFGKLTDLAQITDFAAFVLTVNYGLYWLLFFVRIHLSGGISETEEWLIFVEGWTVVPLLALAATCAVQRAAARSSAGLCHDTLAFLTTCAALASAVSLRVAWLSDSLFVGIYTAVLFLIPALTLAALLTRSWVDRIHTGLSTIASRERLRLVTLLLLASTVGVAGCSVAPTAWQLAAIMLLAGSVVAVSRAARWQAAPGRSRKRSLIDACALVLLPLVLFDPHLHFDPVHHEWFLGPANAILHGRTLLVDVISAYGVGSIYFVALIFGLGLAPLSYPGFALVNSVMVILEYAALYLLMRRVLRSSAHAVVGTIAIFYFHFVGVYGAFTVYPSAGPIRFALPYLLVLLVALRGRSNRPLPWKIGEAAIVGLASIWSLETFFYTIAAYAAVVSCEIVARLRGGPRWPAPTVTGLVYAAAFSGIAHGVLAAYTYRRAGVWPHWTQYLAAVRAFGFEGSQLVLAKASLWGGCIALATIYFASLIGCLFSLVHLRTARGGETLLVASAMTVTGIAQFSYYLGQSIHYRLHTVAIPGVFLAAFWWERLSIHLRLRRHPGVAFAAYAGALIALIQVWGPFTAWAPHSGVAALWRVAVSGTAATATSHSTPQRPATRAEIDMANAYGSFQCADLGTCFRRQPLLEETAQTLALLDKYAPHAERAAVFVNFAATTEVCLLLGKRHAFPMSAASHDGLIPANAERILSADHGLRAGDIIFVNRVAVERSRKTPRTTTPQSAQWFVTRMVDRLCLEFRCEPVERYGAISAERLVARTAEGQQ